MEFKVLKVKSEPIEIEFHTRCDDNPEQILPDINYGATDLHQANLKKEIKQEARDQVQEFLESSYLLGDQVAEDEEVFNKSEGNKGPNAKIKRGRPVKVKRGPKPGKRKKSEGNIKQNASNKVIVFRNGSIEDYHEENLYVDYQINEDDVIDLTEPEALIVEDGSNTKTKREKPVKRRPGMRKRWQGNIKQTVDNKFVGKFRKEFIEEVYLEQILHVDLQVKDVTNPIEPQAAIVDAETQQEENVTNQPSAEKSPLLHSLLKEGRATCKHCKAKIPKTLLKSHIETCFKNGKHSKSLQYHKKFKCKICKKDFGHNDVRFISHLRTHKELGVLFYCNCGERFSKKEYFESHLCKKINKNRSCTEHKGFYFCDTCNKFYVNLFIYSLHTCKPETKNSESLTTTVSKK